MHHNYRKKGVEHTRGDYKNFKRFTRLVEANGYSLARVTGSHYIYVNDSGKSITVNVHLNRMVMQRLIKENDLKGE